jgi:hypothetical protein
VLLLVVLWYSAIVVFQLTANARRRLTPVTNIIDILAVLLAHLTVTNSSIAADIYNMT